ncbi:type III secretion protein, partial [bacterium]
VAEQERRGRDAPARQLDARAPREVRGALLRPRRASRSAVNEYAAIHAGLLVFVRIGAALMSAPGFSANSIPAHIRIVVGVALAGALTSVVQTHVAPVPPDLAGLLGQVLTEAATGILIGMTLNLAVQAAGIAGTFLDAQVGLSMSQVMNPIDGVPVSILGQFKTMLAVVVFLTLDAHHLLFQALVRSYDAAPVSLDSLPAVLSGVQTLMSMALVTAVKIAAPALGATLLVDAALGVLSRAVPQLQPLQIGMPAKIGAGLLAVAFGLPALVGGVSFGVEAATGFLMHLFAGAR